MGRPGIDPRLVIDAAQALREAGERVSVPAVSARIQQETGKTPSYSTLQRLLEDWKDSSASQHAAPVPEMPERARAAFDRAWDIAAREAQNALDAERMALKTLRETMAQERGDMATEIKRLEGLLEQAGETATGLKDDLAAERETRAQAEARATELAVANARLDEQAKAANARADELRGQLENLQKTLREALRQPARTRGRQGAESKAASD